MQIMIRQQLWQLFACICFPGVVNSRVQTTTRQECHVTPTCITTLYSVLHTTPPQTPVSLHPTLSPVSSLLSTPSKKNSSQPPGSSGVLQKDLKEILGEELSNQVWEFSAEHVADMLRPSEYPKRADAIEAAACHLSDILKTNPPIFPGSEGGSYEPLAFVLNAWKLARVLHGTGSFPRTSRHGLQALGFMPRKSARLMGLMAQRI